MNTSVSPVNILFRLMNEQDKIIQCENRVFSTKRGYVLLWQFLVEINFEALQIYNLILLIQCARFWSNCRHRVLKLTEDISGLWNFVSFIFGLDSYFISRITNSLLNSIRCEKRIARICFVVELIMFIAKPQTNSELFGDIWIRGFDTYW